MILGQTGLKTIMHRIPAVPKQSAKARLFEMVIRCQGARDAALLHDDERQTVSQAPALIRSGIVQAEGGSKVEPAEWHKLDGGSLMALAVNASSAGAGGRMGQGGEQLPQDRFGCQQPHLLAIDPLFPADGDISVLVAPAKQGDPESSIYEYQIIS
jgi:hypothetical protein